MKTRFLQSKKLLLVALMAMMGGKLWAVDAVVDGIKYSFTKNWGTGVYTDASVISNTENPYSGNIVIPSEVTYPGESYSCPVLKISGNAFSGCTGLTSITIPSSVTEIGATAFSGCTGLTSITIPSSVTKIGSKAFQNCTGLTEINYNVKTHSAFTSSTAPFYNCNTNNITLNLGYNVEDIPAFAFYCAKIAGSIIIPASVTSIGTSAFSNSVYVGFSTVYLMRSTPPTLANANTFKTSYSSYCDIKVLYSSDHSIITAYQEAENWSTFSSSISETNNVTITNLDLTEGTLTIPAGNTITVTGTLTNPDASNLVIKNGGQLICNNEVQATVQKSITGYGDNEYGWYFIASPVTEDLAPSAVANMTDNEYRLYYYNEPDHYWKYTNGLDNFSLTNGKGYLYASQADETLSFSGTVNASNDPITVENLSYTTDAGDLAGFNLVGNPFPCNATVNCDAFYKMDENGEFLEAATSGEAIAPCTGVMVQLESAGGVTFTKSTEPASISRGIVNLKVNRTSGLFVDNAIVRFDGGSLLNKLVIKEDATRIYLPKGNQEYAIVNAEGEGELPVNFKASENGVYIIAADVDTEVVSYLHLIDNITGANVDLLASPVYTFTAKTTDYAYRFRLVFNASDIAENSATTETFAYFNGNEWQVISEGNATLSLIDMTGRVVSTKQIEGNATVSTDDLTAGVYVMRLESEMTVRTQKIVVK